MHGSMLCISNGGEAKVNNIEKKNLFGAIWVMGQLCPEYFD